jgi:hypothetical protein
MERDFWLSLVVYNDFRGVPVRKAIAEGYLDLRKMSRPEQARLIRLGSLFFQGRSWRKFAGVSDEPEQAYRQLDEQERAEVEEFRAMRQTIGAAVVKLLDDDETLDKVRRDVTIERLETMGFLDGGDES